MGLTGQWEMDYSVEVDFEAKGGVYLDRVLVEGRASIVKDGFDYEYGSIHGWHDLGTGVEEILTATVSCYSPRRKAWVEVSKRLSDAILKKHEDWITKLINKQVED